MANEPLEKLLPTTFVGQAAKAISSGVFRLQQQERAESESKKPRKFSITENFEFIRQSYRGIVTIGSRPEKYWGIGTKRVDQLRVYNPTTYMWESVYTILSNVLTSVVGSHQETDVEKLATYLFNKGVLDGGVPVVPDMYTGMRFQLFENGILDVQKMEMINVETDTKAVDMYDASGDMGVQIEIPQAQFHVKLGDVGLPALGFTPKHMHHINFYKDAENHRYATGSGEGTWSIDGWFRRLAGNDMSKIRYIQFMMGIMLAPNHRFNGFLEINGAPNSGKTTLINLVNDVYGNPEGTIMGANISAFKEAFPFRGNISEDTNLVHVTETNGAYLNEEQVDFLNSFANDSMQMKQMGSESLTLTPPPLMVLEGKGWARFNSVQTGVARRLMPLDLTGANTKGYTSKHYGRKIFKQKKVLERVAYLAMSALSEYTKGNDNYMLQLDNIETLPVFAREWHVNAVNAGDETMTTFVKRVKSFLKPGYIQANLFYDIFLESVKEDSSSADDRKQYTRGKKSFIETAPVFFQDIFKFEPEEGDLIKHSEEEIGIDFEKMKLVMPTPESLKNGYEASAYGKYPKPDWFKITPVNEEVKEFDENDAH